METQEQNTALEKVTTGPARLGEFLNDTRDEMRKVSWPSRKETQATTTVVLVTVFIFAAYFYVIDLVLSQGIDKFLLKLTKH